MKFINLPQGSSEWLKMRSIKITSTDAPIVMRISPFKNRRTLWLQKMGLEEIDPINSKMQRGTELEPIARELAIKELGIEFSPAVVEHDAHNWLISSLDGISPCLEYILEIKCPSEDVHNLAIQGAIKNYYQCQLQHHLLVTCSKKAFYCSYRPEHAQPLVILEIEPCIEMQAEMFEEERIFFEMMRNGVMPEDESFKFKLNVQKGNK